MTGPEAVPTRAELAAEYVRAEQERARRAPVTPEQKEAEYLAALISYWTGRLDGFCAEMKSQGWTVDRDGLSVRLSKP